MVTSRPILDIHVHLFSLNECTTGCYISPRLQRSLLFRIIQLRLRIRSSAPPFIQDEKLQGQIRHDLDIANGVGRIVILALDAVYDEQGRENRARTTFFVPNDYVFGRAREDPRLLPGASVNPFRVDALAQLDRCAEAGAVLIKWIPNTQGFDPGDRRLTRFYQRLRDLGLPLLCHTGPEYSLKAINQDYGNPGNLVRALDEGVTVIAAHGGGSDLRNWGKHFNGFVEMLLHYPNLYTDTSALCLPPRIPYLLKLLRIPEIHDKILHGSDYPLPISAWYFLGILPIRTILEIDRIPSTIERDYRIKKALGFPNKIFTAAWDLLCCRQTNVRPF